MNSNNNIVTILVLVVMILLGISTAEETLDTNSKKVFFFFLVSAPSIIIGYIRGIGKPVWMDDILKKGEVVKVTGLISSTGDQMVISRFPFKKDVFVRYDGDQLPSTIRCGNKYIWDGNKLLSVVN